MALGSLLIRERPGRARPPGHESVFRRTTRSLRARYFVSTTTLELGSVHDVDRLRERRYLATVGLGTGPIGC